MNCRFRCNNLRSASGCEKWSRNKVFAGLLYKEKSGHWEVHVKSELQKTVHPSFWVTVKVWFSQLKGKVLLVMTGQFNHWPPQWKFRGQEFQFYRGWDGQRVVWDVVTFISLLICSLMSQWTGKYDLWRGGEKNTWALNLSKRFFFFFLNPFSKVVTSVQTFLCFLAEGVDCAVSSADTLKDKTSC